MRAHPRLPVRNAFSLIELVIVLVVIGVIGAIAIPRMTRGSNQAAKHAFIRDLKVFVRAAELYKIETGSVLPAGITGSLPNRACAEYLVESPWTSGTPIGGQWDVETRDTGGVNHAIGVHFSKSPRQSDEYMKAIDADLDDGDPDTGRFRRLASGRYYWVLVD